MEEMSFGSERHRGSRCSSAADGGMLRSRSQAANQASSPSQAQGSCGCCAVNVALYCF